MKIISKVLSALEKIDTVMFFSTVVLAMMIGFSYAVLLIIMTPRG